MSGVRHGRIKKLKGKRSLNADMKITQLVKKFAIGGIAVSMVVGGVALAPTMAARAATSAFVSAPVGATPGTPAPATPESTAKKPDGARLQKLYEREQDLQARQQQRLDNTAKVISETQQYIDKQNAAGKDTSVLVSALNTYKAAVTTAQGDHSTAQGILDTHAGFDASGKVVDAEQARATVKDAGIAQREFHLVMNQAGVNLHTAVQLYRLAQR
jgi:hypothetical protein